MRFTSAAILGSGSFGTAVAKLISPQLDHVLLIGRDADSARMINEQHRNPQYLAGVELPANVSAGTDVSAAADHPLVIFVVPTSVMRECAEEIARAGLPDSAVLISCSKGIEKCSGNRMSQILGSVFPNNPVAVLSGPNHAEEIAVGQPACAVIGSENPGVADELQELFTLPHFRAYTSTDLAGIELGGAIKNVYAIAAGMAHGLGLGDNAVAALVTRALAEMSRLGVALGGRSETFSGLSGVGDLLVTCFSEHSRNHRVGYALGKGQTMEEAVASLGMVAEGVPNTLSIHDAARKAGVRTPIIDAVHAILYQNKPTLEAMRELLERDPRPENS